MASSSGSGALLQQTLWIVGAAVALPFALVFFVCEAASACEQSGECVKLSLDSARYLPQCSYKRSPGLTAAFEYFDDSTNRSGSALQAYCAPGERLQLYDEEIATDTTTSACSPAYTYPNSLQPEIYQPSGASYSARACGAWIDAGSAPSAFGASYWSFSGLSVEIDAVRDAVLAAPSPDTNLQRFAESCEQTVLAGEPAILNSIRDSFAYLVDESGIDKVGDVDAALRAAGVLVGHYCDGPVALGWTYGSSTAFSAVAAPGRQFSDTAFGEGLQLVGEAYAAIEASVEANRQVNAAAAAATAFPTQATLATLYEGAVARKGGELVNASAASFPISYSYANELVGFESVARDDPSVARAYLRGLAAQCSLTVSSALGYSAVSSWSASARELRAHRAARVEISALGRLRSAGSELNEEWEPMRELSDAELRNATTATLSQLTSASFASAGVQCTRLIHGLFPDTVDAQRFETVYSDALYQKLELTVARVRRGVADVLREDARVRDVLVDPDAIALDVESVRLRIPGAPRGTWAGATRPLPFVVLDSSHSFFRSALRQARQVFVDRQAELVLDSDDMCEGPPAMDSLTPNAYIVPSVGCSYYLLGLSLRPFLDSTFDEESLLSRFGYVVAHELAHSTLNTPWVVEHLEVLLQRYRFSTYSEAIADVVAGLGLMRSNANWAYQLASQKLCDHVAQTWCARVGAFYYDTPGGVHPKANRRGDFFCGTLLEDLGA